MNFLDSDLVLNAEIVTIGSSSLFARDEDCFEKRQKDVRGIIAEGFQYLKSVNHVNVCGYTDMLRVDDNLYLLISEGYTLSLAKVVEDICACCKDGRECSNECYKSLNLTHIVNQIICGLQYLHSRHISHGRLTLDNIFVMADGTVKLGSYAQSYLSDITSVYLSDQISKDLHSQHENVPDCMNGILIGDSSHMNCGSSQGFTRFVKSRLSDLRLMACMSPSLIVTNRDYTCKTDYFKNDVWSLGLCILQIMMCIVSRMKSASHNMRNEIEVDDFNEDIKCKNSGDMSVEAFYKSSSPLECLNGSQIYSKIAEIATDGEYRAVLNDAFVLVSSILCLFSNCDMGVKDEPLSAIGLDIRKMVIRNLIPEPEPPEGVSEDECFIRICEMINEKCVYGFDSTRKFMNNISFDSFNMGCGFSKTELPSGGHAFDTNNLYYYCVSLAIHWMTGKEVVDALVNLMKTVNRADDSECEDDNKVDCTFEELYYLFALAHDCLIIDNRKRPTVMDLIGKGEMLHDSHFDEQMTMGENCLVWRCGRRLIKNNGTSRELQSIDSDTLKRGFKRDFSCERHFRSEELSKYGIKLDDIFYYWRLFGNDPLNLINQKPNVPWSLECDRFRCATRNIECDVTEYKLQDDSYEQYSMRKICLNDLVSHIRMANLLPMVIEHQLRPTCAYARQYCFVYNWIRIQRFNRLLQNETESKRQIFLESQFDIPSLLRPDIWCIILGVSRGISDERYSIETQKIDHQNGIMMAKDIEKAVACYDNDLLYSKFSVHKIARAVDKIQKMYAQEALPSSIYSLCIPLFLIYYDNEEVYLRVLEAIFDKYLKEYYIPSGSFIQNDLSEFTTILNFFDPEAASHLRKIGAYADSYALSWFMTLFAENTSVEQLYLIWDCMLTQNRHFAKYFAVTIIHNIRERLLDITNATEFTSFMLSVLDSLNAPMLGCVAKLIFNCWSDVLGDHGETSQKDEDFIEIRNKLKGNNYSNANKKTKTRSMAANSGMNGFNLDKNTFAFISHEYPIERCFKLSLDGFSKVFDTCIIIDLRSVDDYNLGHIPNSCHISTVFATLSECDRGTITSIPMGIFKKNRVMTSIPNFDTIASSHSKQSQVLSNFGNLLTSRVSRHPWLHETVSKDNPIILVVGDGFDPEYEGECLQRLIFEFHLQHVCYYRINTSDWPKFFTLSKIRC